MISITDGQFYLSPTLFELGVLPAVDVGKSVSRVGGKAQFGAYRAVAGDLKLAYSQFEELETFARFGTRLDEPTRKIIEHGKRIRACLKQAEFERIPVPEQIVVLLALTERCFDHVPLDNMPEAQRAVGQTVEGIPVDVRRRFSSGDKLNEADRAASLRAVNKALASFQKSS